MEIWSPLTGPSFPSDNLKNKIKSKFSQGLENQDLGGMLCNCFQLTTLPKSDVFLHTIINYYHAHLNDNISSQVPELNSQDDDKIWFTLFEGRVETPCWLILNQTAE